MPSVNGSASGLFKMVCISAPASERLTPMSRAMTAIGKRSFHSTVCVWSSRLEGFTMPLMTSPGLMSMAPTKLLTTNATAAIRHRPATMLMRCQVSFLCCCVRAATSALTINSC